MNLGGKHGRVDSIYPSKAFRHCNSTEITDQIGDSFRITAIGVGYSVHIYRYLNNELKEMSSIDLDSDIRCLNFIKITGNKRQKRTEESVQKDGKRKKTKSFALPIELVYLVALSSKHVLYVLAINWPEMRLVLKHDPIAPIKHWDREFKTRNRTYSTMLTRRTSLEPSSLIEVLHMNKADIVLGERVYNLKQSQGLRKTRGTRRKALGYTNRVHEEWLERERRRREEQYLAPSKLRIICLSNIVLVTRNDIPFYLVRFDDVEMPKFYIPDVDTFKSIGGDLMNFIDGFRLKDEYYVCLISFGERCALTLVSIVENRFRLKTQPELVDHGAVKMCDLGSSGGNREMLVLGNFVDYWTFNRKKVFKPKCGKFYNQYDEEFDFTTILGSPVPIADEEKMRYDEIKAVEEIVFGHTRGMLILMESGNMYKVPDIEHWGNITHVHIDGIEPIRLTQVDNNHILFIGRNGSVVYRIPGFCLPKMVQEGYKSLTTTSYGPETSLARVYGSSTIVTADEISLFTQVKNVNGIQVERIPRGVGIVQIGCILHVKSSDRTLIPFYLHDDTSNSGVYGMYDGVDRTISVDGLGDGPENKRRYKHCQLLCLTEDNTVMWLIDGKDRLRGMCYSEGTIKTKYIFGRLEDSWRIVQTAMFRGECLLFICLTAENNYYLKIYNMDKMVLLCSVVVETFAISAFPFNNTELGKLFLCYQTTEGVTVLDCTESIQPVAWLGTPSVELTYSVFKPHNGIKPGMAEVFVLAQSNRGEYVIMSTIDGVTIERLIRDDGDVVIYERHPYALERRQCLIPLKMSSHVPAIRVEKRNYCIKDMCCLDAGIVAKREVVLKSPNVSKGGLIGMWPVVDLKTNINTKGFTVLNPQDKNTPEIIYSMEVLKMIPLDEKHLIVTIVVNQEITYLFLVIVGNSNLGVTQSLKINSNTLDVQTYRHKGGANEGSSVDIFVASSSNSMVIYCFDGTRLNETDSFKRIRFERFLFVDDLLLVICRRVVFAIHRCPKAGLHALPDGGTPRWLVSGGGQYCLKKLRIGFDLKGYKPSSVKLAEVNYLVLLGQYSVLVMPFEHLYFGDVRHGRKVTWVFEMRSRPIAVKASKLEDLVVTCESGEIVRCVMQEAEATPAASPLNNKRL